MDEYFQQLLASIGEDPIQFLLYQLGTFAGAVSGIRLAVAKKFDWFGAFVIGFITAIGGGTLRDILLQTHPFWMDDPIYVVTTLLALIMMWLFGRRFISEKITWFVFDTIAIAAFMVVGLEKSLSAGFGSLVSIIMGVITAVFGGVLRDIFINQVPLIFRRELYAMACAAGGGLYIILVDNGVSTQTAGILCVVSIFVLRALAIRYGWGVPVLRGRGFVHEAHYSSAHRHGRGSRDNAGGARRNDSLGQ